MKTYKAFDSNWKCRGFQYEVGKEYTMDGDIELCNKGFHACKIPLDVLQFYPLIDINGKLSKFAEVEQDGKLDNDNIKVASSKITIKTELKFIDMVKIHFTMVRESIEKAIKDIDKNKSASVTTGDNAPAATTGNKAPAATTGYYAPAATTGNKAPAATTGNYAPATTTGYYAPAATTGYNAPAATTGDYAPAATTGYNAPAATTGYNAPATTTGYNAPAATTGDYAPAATTGNYAPAVTTGDYAPAATTGDYAPAATTGYNAIASAIGVQGKASADKGWIIIVDWQYCDNDWQIKEIYHAKVGDKIKNKIIKANTYYWFEDGKLKSEKI